MSRQNKGIQIQLGLRWIDDGSPVVAANQFMLQSADQHFQLVVGHATFPLVTGTPEEQTAAVEAMGAIPVHVRGRFILDESGLRGLHRILDNQVSKEDR